MNLISTSTSFTRPADTTAYAANDLVANSTTAGSVVPMSFTIPKLSGFKLYKVSIARSNATVTNAKFNLHLYGLSPTCSNGDNGAWLTTASNWLGSFAVDGSTQTFSDTSTAYAISATYPFLLLPAGRTIYGLLQATAAYTPASAEVFTVTLTGESYA